MVQLKSVRRPGAEIRRRRASISRSAWIRWPTRMWSGAGHPAPFPRVMCAAPAYLARCEALLHPRDLVDHPCLSFSLAGSIWAFNSLRT